MTTTIKAIETRYAGCRFRSRLEARWAVFFDRLGIRWEYEPQGYELPSGPYLPDFWLPDFDIWWEVKGVEPGPHGRESTLAEELSQGTGKAVYTAWGPMPDVVDCGGRSAENRGIQWVMYDPRYNYCGGDIDYAFCACPWCGKIGLEYSGRSARICGWQAHHGTEEAALAQIQHLGHWRADDKCYTADHPAVIAAYRAARSARFEHGENGR